MRDRFNDKPELFLYDIESAEILEKCRYSIVGLMASLLEIYKNKDHLERILDILENSLPTKRSTGPNGLSLWQIFVLAQSRLCANISYEQLHYLANHDILIRHILGIRSRDGVNPIFWGYQRIYDNVNLLTDEAIKEINTVIIDFGHEVFKQKGGGSLTRKNR